jgi:hypothetical protein
MIQNYPEKPRKKPLITMIQNYPEKPRKKPLITIPLDCFFCPQNKLSEQDHKINVDTIDGEDTR